MTGAFSAFSARGARPDACPCGSGSAYRSCCEPLHDGADAVTAEALMRARYSAYALGRTDYLFRTWHPRTRPVDLTPDPELVWQGLEVVRTEAGSGDDDTGLVEFRADYRSPAGSGHLHETSRFQRRGGRWVYVDGDLC